MNRIILIGNGFDLAHGMKTSYNDFINNYWENVIKAIIDKIDKNATTNSIIFVNEEIIIKDLPAYWIAGNWMSGSTFEELVSNLKTKNLRLIFKNKFLEILTMNKNEQNWVDIEIEYYTLLKESFKNINCRYYISELNRDFSRIQVLLELYLKEVEEKFVSDFSKNRNNLGLRSNIGSKIYSPFELKDFTEAAINKKAEVEFLKFQAEMKGLNELDKYGINQNIISRIGSDGTLEDVRGLLVSDTAKNYFNLTPDGILFLNFNYTFTEKLYSDPLEITAFSFGKEIETQNIHIHGTTNKKDRNNIIFGFGDEIDEDYKSIENLNNNDYLENIKSIKYLETDNYKQLLEYLNSGYYQIYIFGHSCGISDRTLLNTLFEHKNCSSIKPFYHKKDYDKDNYRDIVKNISRSFNSKVMMRDRVVNKEYCEPLL